MKKKRKYVKRKITDDLIIKEITRIRTRNNKLWMGILKVAHGASPKGTGKLLNEIVKNDQRVTKWMDRLGRGNPL